MKGKFILIAALLLLCSRGLFAQDATKVLNELSDTLTTLSIDHFKVKCAPIKVWRSMKRGEALDLYFENDMSDLPWKSSDIAWFRGTLQQLWPESLKSYKIGEFFCRNTNLKDLTTPAGLWEPDGKPLDYKFNYRSHTTAPAFIEELGVKHPSKGLYRRGIALWHSHGLYFDGQFWSWQRTPIWRTVEDLYTQSYVLPFLIPMLENAGARVFNPRERDTNYLEVVCDNDPSFSSPHNPAATSIKAGTPAKGTRKAATSIPTEFESCEWAQNFGEEPLPQRTHGSYTEEGKWQNAGPGFADFKLHYTFGDNPFTAGSARQANTVNGEGNARVRWTPTFSKDGRYAVYISYKSLKESTTSAHYTVKHAGGKSEFVVNQQLGGGTWIYLGTFDFGEGTSGYVELDNGTPNGYKGGKIVSADAVRFGGGIGKVARGSGVVADNTWKVSGIPAHAEGALYSMQYAGAPESVINKWEDDYTNDYASRGAWVKWMKDHLHIPIDLSLALHSDAGVTPDNHTIGTLAIYSLLENHSSKFKNGQSRMASRFLGDCIQSEITGTLSARYDTLWQRRQLRDGSYSESRTTDVPGLLLEILSHQNFADMKYGLDPQFRFDVSRCIYKGILKFISSYYGVTYAVQPLPVSAFSAVLSGNNHVFLSWKAETEPGEPTSAPLSYMVYTKVDGGAWDAGVEVMEPQASLPVSEGHIYSYKVVALNEGGCSFPSEILSVGCAAQSKGEVLIINNFTRVSGPAFFDSPSYGGFDEGLDSGVPWGSEINFIGETYEHRRDSEYYGNNSPGFGASHYNFAGRSYAGNTFNYPYIHGKALLDLGYSFSSSSVAAISSAIDSSSAPYCAIDIICGKQVSTIVGSGYSGIKYPVFPEDLRLFVCNQSALGTNIIISGAYIASEGHDSIYPIKDPAFADYQKAVRGFINGTLGYKWVTNRASHDARILPYGSFSAERQGSGIAAPYTIFNSKNTQSYCVENPDGIKPNNSKGKVGLIYQSSKVGAGVFYNAGTYKVASYGFPLETLTNPSDLLSVLAMAMNFFCEK